MSTEPTHTKHSVKAEAGKSDAYVTRTEQGLAVIRRNVLWALGAGVVPFPIFDVLAIMAVEVKMLKQLSDVYGVKFSEDLAKKLTSSLLGSLGSIGIGSAIGLSLAKFIPIIGTTLGFVSVPVIAAAATHAIGKVFQMHFETGGTLLDFDPHAVRSYFKQEFEDAKETLRVEHSHRTTKA